MTHADDVGLVCPPRLAPRQVVVVPIWKGDDGRAAVLEVASRIERSLQQASIRCKVDDRDGMKPGAKYYEWEGRGVPVRIEIGPRDIAEGQCMVARRTGGKSPLPLDGIGESVARVLDEIQQGLLDAARERRDANSVRNVDKEALLEIMGTTGGFAYGGFCGREECELAVKDATKATVRVLPDEEFQSPEPPTTCTWCGEPSTDEALWARAY